MDASQDKTTFKPEESLALIHATISTAKNKLADDGFLLIFWGWLVTISALIHYTTIQLEIPYGELVWPVLMPLGGIFSAIYSARNKRKTAVKTYIDSYLGYVWLGFGISLLICLGMMPFNGIKHTYFFLMILYAITTFISGGILKFQPLIFGSFFAFLCAIASVFSGEKEQFLWLALSLICSYVIPGHMLRAKFKSASHAERS